MSRDMAKRRGPRQAGRRTATLARGRVAEPTRPDCRLPSDGHLLFCCCCPRVLPAAAQCARSQARSPWQFASSRLVLAHSPVAHSLPPTSFSGKPEGCSTGAAGSGRGKKGGESWPARPPGHGIMLCVRREGANVRRGARQGQRARTWAAACHDPSLPRVLHGLPSMHACMQTGDDRFGRLAGRGAARARVRGHVAYFHAAGGFESDRRGATRASAAARRRPLSLARISTDPAEHGVAVRKTRFRRSRVGFGSVAGAEIVKKKE